MPDNPVSPLAGQQVDFSSKVSDPEEDPVSLAWTFGDDEAAIGAAPIRAFKDPGAYTVTVTATDSNRAATSASHEIVVQPETGPSSSFDFDDDGDFDDFSGAVAEWAFDSPGEHQVRLPAEQAVGSVVTTAATRLVRFPKCERRLRAGIRPKLFVRQTDRIGKYTRFLIRGAPPERLDLCLWPGSTSLGRCP
ncbi:MAG TPA: PKD domain-containing protein [Thermoleophilaceae bacterium]